MVTNARRARSRILLAEAIAAQYTEAIVNGSLETVGLAVQSQMGDTVQSVIDVGRTGVQRQLRRFATALENETNRPDRRRTVHQRALDRAIAAGAQAYEDSKEAHEPFAARENRFAGGILGAALRSPQMGVATFDGVAYVNESFLNSRAAQWGRLNYGAGERGASTPAPGDHTIRLFNRAAGAISIKSRAPGDPFDLPAGRFGFDNARNTGFPDASRRGEDFTPSSGPQFESPGAVRFYSRRPTKGIQGRMFLDAGAKELADGLGQGYTQLMNEWYVEAVKKSRGPFAGTAEDEDLRAEAQILADRSRLNEEIVASFGRTLAALRL